MLSNGILAIDFGTKNIKIAQGKNQFGNIVINNLYTIPTPRDSIKDGKIIDSLSLMKCLNDFMAQNGIKAKKAIVTIQSTSVITRELTLPYAKDEALKNMVQFEVEQYLPIMLNEYVIEHRILEEFTEEEAKKLKILVAAMPLDISKSYFEFIKALKLRPIALDIHTNSISKLFDKNIKINDENYSTDKTVAVIDIGNTYINLSIIKDGIHEFSRLIEQGGREIDIEIANSFNLALDEAEEKKIEHDSIEAASESLTSSSMINEIIRSSINEFIDGIRRLFQYYTSRSHGNKVDQIFLYGGSSKIKGLLQYFSSNLNITTARIENISNIKLSKNIEDGDLEYYLNAIASIKRR